MPKPQRIWKYEVTDVTGSMKGQVTVGATILDRWMGRGHTYSIFDHGVREVTGSFTVKLIGEASEEAAETVRRNWDGGNERMAPERASA